MLHNKELDLGETTNEFSSGNKTEWSFGQAKELSCINEFINFKLIVEIQLRSGRLLTEIPSCRLWTKTCAPYSRKLQLQYWEAATEGNIIKKETFALVFTWEFLENF